MSKFSVKKPITVFVAVVIILVTGIVSFTKMTPDLFPNIDMPYVIIVTPYVGATPEKVETDVTKPLEQNMATLEDIKNVQSVSDSNYSMIVLEFENTVNMDTISSDILQKVNLSSTDWDDSVGTSTIMKINPNMIPVSVAAVSYKGKDRAELSSFVQDTLLNKLEGTSGVASIDDSGVLEEKVSVVINQKKIDALNAKMMGALGNSITADTVSGILKGQNFSMPAGYVQEKGSNYLVSVGDSITTEEQAKNLVLFDTGVPALGKVYLKDVADVFMSNNASSLYAKINGRDGIVLSFSKQSNFATADVCENIQKQFSTLSDEYEGLDFSTLMNQGDYIHMVINAILSSLMWGALFAILILLLFLRGIRPTLITIVSIPVSIVFAIVLMYFSGVTINLISMSGLAVSVGMLVDNSVVVIENIVRLRRKGISAPKAAVAGAKQVGGAITASTLTTVCVFLPIVFTNGITREMFTDMALTIGYSLIASLIIAMTVVPAMSSKLLTKESRGETKFFLSLQDKYRTSIAFVLSHKVPMMLIVIALLVGSIGLTVSKGFEFMPEMSSPQIQATLEMPKESSTEEAMKTADKAIKKIESVKDVETVGAILSSDNNMMMMGRNNASISFYIMLNRDMKRTSTEVADDINRKCKNLDGELTAAGSSMSDFSSALGETGVTINLYGSQLDDLQSAAEKIGKKLSKVQGIKDVDNGLDDTDTEFHFVVDKTKALQHGYTVAQVYEAVVDAMKYEEVATSVMWDGESYDMVVSSDSKPALKPDNMKNLTVSIENKDGDKEQLKVSDVATLEEKSALKAINRDNQSRTLTVSGTLKKGYNVTKVTSAAEDALKGYNMPGDTRYEFVGENQTIMDAMSDLVLMMLLGIIFVYLIMVAQFQSFKSPFIIMFTIPLAATGGLLALLITGKTISVIAMIGFIMLCGIIVNNGIVLVDYVNQLRAGGMDKRQALIEAGVTRMRPILMTSLTTILGLIVMVFGKTAGTDMMQPVALVCIGGLLYATLLTLYVVPIMYDIMNGEKYKHIKEEELDVSDILM